MTVNYYSINGCKYELLAGKPVIIAPENTDEAELKKYNFTNLDDGRWVRYINNAEFAYIKAMLKENYSEIYITDDVLSEVKVNTDNQNAIANILCAGSLFLSVFGIVLAGFFNEIYSFISFIMMLAVGLMIFVRIKYPKNIFGKVLMVIYIIGYILSMILFIFAMFLIASCVVETCNECSNLG
jgi:hypothetical protein